MEIVFNKENILCITFHVQENTSIYQKKEL